jgi:hypothetical protein
MGPGQALVRTSQDREQLLPGEAAVLTIEVAAGGARVPSGIKGGELRRLATTDGAQPEWLAGVSFHDDGLAPDRVAKDGISVARVALPPRAQKLEGDLIVRADVSTASETGEVAFHLVGSGAPLADFTGNVREAIEDGFLVFYANVRVRKAGRFDFMSRLYDREHRAMALLVASATLDPSTREVRVGRCGRLLRDEDVPGPWELRDLEGFGFTDVEGRPARTPMATWKGPHPTGKYALETFSGGSEPR